MASSGLPGTDIGLVGHGRPEISLILLFVVRIKGDCICENTQHTARHIVATP